jgi:hypothetical protein
MIFEEALAAMRHGKKIRYKLWDTRVYMYKDTIFVDGKYISHPFYTATATMMREILDDKWEIVEEKPKFTREQVEYIKNKFYKLTHCSLTPEYKSSLICYMKIANELESLCE